MGDLMAPNSEVSQVGFPQYLRRLGERLNSEPIGKQVGPSDVYDSCDVMLNRNLDPCSMTKGKDNDREGSGTRWQRQREAS